jgi:hypothetical protein
MNKKLLLVIFILKLSFALFSQSIPPPPKMPDFTDFIFSDLLTKNKLHNFKTGLFCSAQRNDTIFVVFYSTIFNDLMCFPIGTLYNEKKTMCINSSYQYTKDKLRPSANILCSHYLTMYKIKKEEIILFHQSIALGIVVQPINEYDLMHRIRILYYSQERGIFHIDYENASTLCVDNITFDWLYKEGDFILK